MWSPAEEINKHKVKTQYDETPIQEVQRDKGCVGGYLTERAVQDGLRG